MDVTSGWRACLLSDRPALAWLDGLKSRRLTALVTAVGLTLTLGYAAIGPEIIGQARSSLDAAERTAADVAQSSRDNPRLAEVAQRAQSHVAEQHQILSSWQRLSLMAWVLTFLALAIIAGILFARVRKAFPIGPSAVIATGLIAAFGDFTVASELDQGLSARGLQTFGAAVLLLAFGAAVDQERTLDERHEDLLQALDRRHGSVETQTTTIQAAIDLGAAARRPARHAYLRWTRRHVTRRASP